MSAFWKTFWLATIILLVLQALFAYGDLPDRMAVHFEWNGTPDSWSSKNTFYLGWFALVFVLNVWPFLVKYLVEKLPPRWISVPEKEYWLANSERTAKLAHILQSTMLSLFSIVNVCMLLGFQYTFDMNTKEESLVRMEYVLGLAGLVGPVLLIHLLVRLNRTDK